METTTQAGGVSTNGLLLVSFVTLKLLGVITWPWVWVLTPLWLPILLVIAVMVGWAIYDRY